MSAMAQKLRPTAATLELLKAPAERGISILDKLREHPWMAKVLALAFPPARAIVAGAEAASLARDLTAKPLSQVLKAWQGAKNELGRDAGIEALIHGAHDLANRVDRQRERM